MLNIDLDLVRRKKILVGTPMYGGMASAPYVVSLAQLFDKAGKYGLNFDLYVVMNESLITRARNSIVDYFLNNDFDYLMFIDADIGFNADDILFMAYLAEINQDKNVIVGIYPKKTINWEHVHRAAVENKIKSHEDYQDYIAEYAFNLDYDKGRDISSYDLRVTEPVKILDAGTGFMLISKNVFEDFIKAYPEQEYRDHDTDKKMYAFFDTCVDPDDGRYISEDYFFTRKVRKIGHDTWMLPWVNLQHMGSYLFEGSFIKAVTDID